MARPLLIAVLATGCSLGDLEGGRYTCDPMGDRAVGSAQCPGQWRCGLEGYCHQQYDTRTAWQCETNDDCESGFRCGLASTRDRHECHHPDDGKPYACDLDTECSGGWRCAAGGLCADPANDALYGGAPVTAADEERLSPLDDRPFDEVSVSPVLATGAGPVQLVVARRGETVDALAIDRDAPSFRRYQLTLPGVTAPLFAYGAHSRTEDENGFLLLDDRPRFFARVGADVKSYTLDADGGVTVLQLTASETGIEFPLPMLPTRFKHATGGTFDTIPGALAFTASPDDYLLRLFGSTPAVTLELLSDGYPWFYEVQGNVMHDFAMLTPDPEYQCIFATDNRGLWVAQRSGTTYSGTFAPVLTASLGNSACPSPLRTQTRRLQTFGTQWFAVETVATGADATLTLYDLSPGISQSGVYHCASSDPGFSCTDPTDRLAARTDLGPCTACPGKQLLDFAIVPAASAPELEVRCGDTAGASSAFFRLAHNPSGGAQCDRQLLLGPSNLFTSQHIKSLGQPIPGQVGWTGPRGEVWVGTSAATAASLTLDRAPDGIALKGTTPRDLLAFTRDLVGVPVPGVGLASTQSLGLTAAVDHTTHWVLKGSSIIDLDGASSVAAGRIIASLAASSTPPPHHATLTRTSSDTRAVVVATGAQVYAGDVESVLSGTDPFAAASLKLTLVNPIQSLAMPATKSAAPGAWLEGYVLTSAGVQRITAETVNRWRTEDVALPGSLTGLEVWFEKDRARVGCTDGSVFSLPSRVRLAPPIPAGAVDFAQTCGQQLALGLDGLYRLDARAGDGTGTWAKLPLPQAFAADGLDGARVHALGRDVYVFTRSGETARVTFATCP